MRAIICLRMEGSDCALGGKASPCAGFNHCDFWMKAEIEVDKYALVDEEDEVLSK